LSDVKATTAAIGLLVSVLGEARMSAVLREKLGLTYSVSSFMVERRAARAMLICTRVKAAETANATRVMLEELAALATRPPSTFELETARAMALTTVATEQDDLSGIVAAWHHAAEMRKPAPPENRAEELRKVTVEDLAAVAKKLAVTDTAQLIFSGERGLVDAAARTNSLGPLKVPVLGRVAE
jgi:predicted Zn-dependent peptidase